MLQHGGSNLRPRASIKGGSPAQGKVPKEKVKNAFAVLRDSSDGGENSEFEEYHTATPITATPETASIMEDSDIGSDPEKASSPQEDSGWSAAPCRRKTRAGGKKSPGTQMSMPRVVSAPARMSDLWEDEWSDGEDADTEWYIRKGQRHNSSKFSKQEWSFKSKERVAAATQKRDIQRVQTVLQAAAVAEDAEDEEF